MQISFVENKLKLIFEENFSMSFADDLQKRIVEAINKSPTEDLILDMRNVELLDSVGVKILVGLYKTCQMQNRKLLLEVSNPDLSKVICLFKLDQLIQVQESLI